MSAPIPVVLLFGPTASGKTEILENLFAGAEPSVPAEVISADSMQVYRGMDIGTAKPDAALRARLPHHLIDIRSPDEQFNAGDFVRLADEAVRNIHGRGKLPVVSGGTGFYLANFVMGLPPAPPSNGEIRRELREERAARGMGALIEELSRADPQSAARIHPHDEYRLLRALEVWRLSGKPLSAFPLPVPAAPRGDYRFLLIGLRRNRETMYRRIEKRTRAMFRAGLSGEVRRLFEAGYGLESPGMKAIGYREFFITKEDGAEDLSEDFAQVEELVARNSRRYAKRQITCFAALPHVIWVDVADEEEVQARGRNALLGPPGLEQHAESVLRGLVGSFFSSDAV
jgi:tRNA dimethylallyltransferase